MQRKKKREKMSNEITSNGWIDLEEFLPSGDTFIVKMLPTDTTKQTESGLIVSSSRESVVEDRPNFGKIVVIGPECKRNIGEYVYVQKAMGYDLKMIRKPTDADYDYVLLYDDAIIGNRVPKDYKREE
jgi:co-chaperonin GroES (HSP10)